MVDDNNSANTEDLLLQVPMFADLSRKELRHLAAVCMPKSYPRGSAIIEEGKAGLGMFIITSGRVEVYKGQGDQKQVLTTREAGGILGEMSLIDNQPRWASVVSLEHTKCLLITRDSFHSLVHKYAGIAWCIVPVLTERFRTVESRLLEQLAHPGAEPEIEAETDESRKAAETAGPQKTRRPTAEPDTETLLDLLRVEYAMLLAGAEGLGRGADIMQDFLKSLARDTALSDSKGLDALMDALPQALKNASAHALAEGERLPERLISTFRRELGRR